MKTRNAKLRLRASNSSRTTIVSNFLLTIGTSITLAALIYMIVNLDKADSIITMWILFMAVGLSLSLWGLLFRLWDKKTFTFTK